MTRSRGRPPKADASSIDPIIRAIATALLDSLTPTRRAQRVAPSGPMRRALLAVRLAEAFEVLAAETVDNARRDGAQTWRDVGSAFDVRPQTAQARFRLDRSELRT